jgi:hypothetical protein
MYSEDFWYFIGKSAKKARASDSEEENVHAEDDSLPQEEETSSQSCVTEDMAQKRRYICCTVLCAVVCVFHTFVDARLVTLSEGRKCVAIFTS